MPAGAFLQSSLRDWSRRGRHPSVELKRWAIVNCPFGTSICARLAPLCRGLARSKTPRPFGRFAESLHAIFAAHWDHEPVRIPLNRPSGTFSPTGGEGWDERVRFAEEENRVKANPIFDFIVTAQRRTSSALFTRLSGMAIPN